MRCWSERSIFFLWLVRQDSIQSNWQTMKEFVNRPHMVPRKPMNKRKGHTEPTSAGQKLGLRVRTNFSGARCSLKTKRGHWAPCIYWVFSNGSILVHWIFDFWNNAFQNKGLNWMFANFLWKFEFVFELVYIKIND